MKIYHRIGRERNNTPSNERADTKTLEKAMNRLTLVGVVVIVSTAAVKISAHLEKK